MVPACVARVHSLLPADWDWSGAKCTPAALSTPTAAAGERAAAAGSTEDLRERAELQRAYYSFLHALVHNGLSGVLLRAPPGTLDAALGALMRGAATHVDAGAAGLRGRGAAPALVPGSHAAREWCAAFWLAAGAAGGLVHAYRAALHPHTCTRHTSAPAGVRKTCVQAVERLAGEWCSAEGGEALPGFRDFVMKQVGAFLSSACFCGVVCLGRGS